MALYPAKQEKTIIIREINADTFTSPLDYWLQTDMLRRRCDELHTIWGPPPLEKGTSMSELSPTAQAVLDAAVTKATLSKKLAAALRAVADEVLPEDFDYWDGSPGDYASGCETGQNERNTHVRRELLAIAAELDGTNTIN